MIHTKDRPHLFHQSNVIFLFILTLGVILRLYFQIGHIYSDDAYYSYLSFTLFKGDFANNYMGYPVFVLRLGQIGLTAIAFTLFGTNETATIIFPFLFSIINIFLTYIIALLFTSRKDISLISAFLICIFPTDVVFATINFPDLINIFFINLGIYLLIRSYKEEKIFTAILGGISIFFSMQFKETAYYFLFLFLLLFIYLLIKEKKINLQLLISVIFIGLNLVIEGFVYLLIHQDFLYRISITAENYKYSYYDFFPYTAQQFSGSENYFKNLFDQIFFINIRSIFPRRFYLFIPITGLIQSIVHVVKKEYKLLTFWFIGIAVLLIAFTTSFTEYKPLDLQRSWYIYPLVMPSVILTSIFLSRFKKVYLNISLVVLFIGSLVMSNAYEEYFQKNNLTGLNNFLRSHLKNLIATDHFTKYSVDLIRGYSADSPSVRFRDIERLSAGTLILYNQKHIDELELQGYSFPKFNFKSSTFEHIKTFGDFDIYKLTGDLTK